MKVDKHFKSLGIPDDYGDDPFLPRYSEAETLTDVELSITGRMQRLAPETAQDWLDMKQAAQHDGVTLLLVSGFRSVADQTAIFRRKLTAGHAIEAILAVNAAPGYSQHHTGRAVDIATIASRPLTEDFETTAAFAWLARHAARFGFTMPYDRDNRYALGFEPWHWSQIRD